MRMIQKKIKEKNYYRRRIKLIKITGKHNNINNKREIRINIEIWNVDKFDGGNTRRIRYDGTAYAGNSTEEVTGTMSSS